MSIDYGTKRIGIAVSDPLQIIATGLDTVATKEIFDFLESYLENEAVETMVVGEPMHLDGNPTHVTPLIEKFILEVKKRFPKIEIARQDERFTSVEAKSIILKSGAKKKKRRDKSLVDKISAVLILQEYMESQRRH